MADQYLDKVYSARTPEETRALYDSWAATYDAELGKNGYATPKRCATALAKFTGDLTAPILDFGCGTGLSGMALKLAGFEVVDGVDLSADMLKEAEAKDVYRSLRQIAPDETPPKGYASIAAIGVIGKGAAPVSTVDLLMHALPKGGKLVLSFNDHALSDASYEARISEWTDTAAARLLVRDYGDHIPGIDLNSMVYVLEKN